MDVSKNRGTPKSSILIGFSLINHPFWGTSIFGNTHILDKKNGWGKNSIRRNSFLGRVAFFFSEAKDVRNRICVFVKEMVTRLGGFKYFFIFTPKIGEDSQI